MAEGTQGAALVEEAAEPVADTAPATEAGDAQPAVRSKERGQWPVAAVGGPLVEGAACRAPWNRHVRVDGKRVTAPPPPHRPSPWPGPSPNAPRGRHLPAGGAACPTTAVPANPLLS